MWVRDMEGVNVDYILLGSSRMNYHIDPIQIEAATGKKGLNLGVNAFSSFESYLMLKEFLRNNDTKRVFVQVDNLVSDDDPDREGEKTWIPYLDEDYVYKEFKRYGIEYSLYRRIPFYRFQKFESRIGYRDVLASALGSGHQYEPTFGYTPTIGVLNGAVNFKKSTPTKLPNHSMKSMISLCEKRNVELIFFTAPIFKYGGTLNQFEETLPNYYDLHSTVEDKKDFSNQTHLNYKGAEKFTDFFLKLFFNSSK